MRTILALAGVGLALGVAPAVASANDYTVHTCRGPGGEPAAADGWSFTGVGADRRSDCLGGGEIGGGPARIPYGHQQHFAWTFEAPGDTHIVGFRVWRTVTVTRGDPWSWNWNLLRDEINFDGLHYLDTCWPLPTTCRSLGDGTISDRTIVALSNTSMRKVIAHMDCNPAPCPASSSGTMRIHRAEFTLRDTSDPAFVGTPSGDLLDTTRPVAGVRSASFVATDKGGGVYRATLEVDGRPVVSRIVDDNGGRCAKPFLSALPCPNTAGGALSLDTAALPDGQHLVRLIVSDTTEANAAVFGPVRIHTQNRVTECDPGVRSSSSPVLASFRRTKRRTITRRSARGVRVVGRIAGAGGGVAVHLLSREQRTGAPGLLVATAVTNPRGAFRLTVPRGPSRRLRAAYRRGGTDAFLVCSLPLNLLVRARATLSASLRGRRVALRGRLLGGRVPRRGKLVTLEARDGGRWRQFATARTDRRGRFRAGYRFSRGARGTYPIRARVPADASYPYALGYSPVVRVRVR